MSIKRHDDSNWIDVGFQRKWDGSNWVDLEFVRRHDGSNWVDILDDGMLYSYGDEFTSKTGGWKTIAYGQYVSSDVVGVKETDCLRSSDLSSTSYGGMCWMPENLLDLSKHSTIHILLDVTQISGNDISVQLATSDKKHSANISDESPLFTKWQSYPVSVIQSGLEITLDVSALTSGYFYIIPYTYSSASHQLEIKIQKVWLT